MSEDQLKAFLEKVKGDTSLQEKLKAASDADAVVSIAKEEGFSISIDDIKALLELSDEAGDVALSDEELEGVAGGTLTRIGIKQEVSLLINQNFGLTDYKDLELR